MSSTVIPCLRYRDAPGMIAWLCEVFRFKQRAVYKDGAGDIAHAELTLGPGMIMLGSARDNEFGRLQLLPADLGASTQSPYLVVADADEIYARVKAGGGKITIGIKNEDHGGRGFSCRDPEGHLWNVGTHDPWGVGADTRQSGK